MRDENVFEVAAYSNKDLRLKGKSIDIKTTNKVDYSITDGHHFSIDDADILSVQSNLTTINTTLDMSSNRITGVDAPVNVKDAANKEYVDEKDVATREYVDSKDTATESMLTTEPESMLIQKIRQPESLLTKDT